MIPFTSGQRASICKYSGAEPYFLLGFPSLVLSREMHDPPDENKKKRHGRTWPRRY